MRTIITALVVLSSLIMPAHAQPAGLTAATFRPYITRWEGCTHHPVWRDDERTVGIGHNTANDSDWEDTYSDADIEALYQRDYARALDACRAEVAAFDWLPLDARMVTLSLEWTVGRHGLHLFRVFRAAMGKRDYERAAAELFSAQWATQVSRARLTDHMHRLRALVPGHER